jgi:hypothetical protein
MLISPHKDDPAATTPRHTRARGRRLRRRASVVRPFVLTLPTLAAFFMHCFKYTLFPSQNSSSTVTNRSHIKRDWTCLPMRMDGPFFFWRGYSTSHMQCEFIWTKHTSPGGRADIAYRALDQPGQPGTAAHPLRSGRPRHRQPRSVPLWESLVSHPMSRGAGIRSSRCPRLRKVVADSALAPHRRAERARCFQVIQTGTTTLRIRLDAEPGAIEARVWMELASRLRTYLAPQRIADMTREGASERPAPHPTSDKFRHV